MMDDPEDWPDLTLSEIEESDEYDTEELNIQEQAEKQIHDYADAMMVLATTTALSKMVEDDHITLQDYIHLTNYLVEWERDLEHSPL